MMHRDRLDSPCIGVCSTTYGDQVCRGCKRFASEVVDWNVYSDEHKALVVERLESYIKSSVSTYFEIVDKELLRARLERENLRYFPDWIAESWLLVLLDTQRVRNMEDLLSCGVKPLSKHRDVELFKLGEETNKLYLQLSQDYSDRFHPES